MKKTNCGKAVNLAQKLPDRYRMLFSITMEKISVCEEVKSVGNSKCHRFDACTNQTAIFITSMCQRIAKVPFDSSTCHVKKCQFMHVQELGTVAMSDSWISTYRSCHQKQYLIEKDIFYVRPLDKIPSDPSAPWYTSVPIGHYTLDKKVSVMCRNAGIMGHKTNRSLRATGATELYRSDVPEKIIQERTGHRSLKALRVYERSTDQQHEAVSSLLSSEKETTFHQQMTEIKQSHHIDARCQPLSGTSNFSFQNLSGCTINIIHQPEKPSTSGP